MASLHTGSDKLLEIRTAHVDLAIRSKGRQNYFIQASDEDPSVLAVVGTEIKHIRVPVQDIEMDYHDRECSGEYNEYRIPVAPLFFEQTDYLVTVQARNGEALEFKSNSIRIEQLVSHVIEDNETLLTGVINYRNDVGYSDLIILSEGKRVLTVRIEIYPSKISYRKDYREMMADVNNMVSESILDFMRRAYQVFVPDHERSEVPAVFFSVLQGLYDSYIRAIKRILTVPKHSLVTEHVVLPYHKSRQTDIRSKRWLSKHPE